MSNAAILQLGPTDQRRLAPLCEEIAEGLGALYGPAAAEDYRARAERIWALNLAHPSVLVLGQLAGSALAGLGVAVRRDDCADIAFVFVGESWRDLGYEPALARALVTRLRAMGVSRIVSECVPLSPLALDSVYAELGFLSIERDLMSVPLQAPALRLAQQDASILLTRNTWSGAAECLVAAYQDAPGRMLHQEMTTVERATEFIERIHGGAYGAFNSGYARGCFQNAACAGVILGAEAAPGVGFVLQVAVEPASRRQGLGKVLIAGLAEQFRLRGLERMALGVTRSNPARFLYESLGFKTVRGVTAYLWSNPLCPPSDS